MLKEKSLEGATVLCRDEQTMRRIKNIVDPKLCPKIMSSKNFDMSHKRVKILTMHVTKGLQFPVVVDSDRKNSIKNKDLEKN